ncbi:MFS transporter [Kitasatospora albolonga]|uniref:MFS transporter n=1 Tax=Kitasatospora albolonga TaxID=68173 RepID=UPI0031E58F5B
MSTTDQSVVAPAAAGDRLDGRQRWLLVLLLGAQFLIALDFSILNVALPDIGTGMGFSPENLQWVVTLFALSSAGFTLLFGRVAEIAGRRNVFMGGMVVLALASLTGGLADSQTVLLVARVAQGLGTAAVAPTAMALLTTSFPEGPARQRALGLSGALLSAGFTTGAVAGGLLTGLVSWRWAFLINIPVCVAVLAVAPGLISDRSRGGRARLDVPGAVTVTGGLLALSYGVTSGGHEGFGSTTTLVSLAAAVVLLGAFWAVELRQEQPLVSLRVLARPTVKWGNLGGLITFTMFSAVIFLMTLYLQQVLDYSPLVTGLAFGLQGAAAFFAGLLAGPLISRLGGSRVTLVGGLVVQSAVTASLFLVGADRSWMVLVLVATTVGGFAHVLSVVSFMVTSTSGLDDEEQGLATGLATLTQQVGITLGIPVMSAVATARTEALSGRTPEQAMLGGTTLALLVDAAIVLVAAVVIGLALRRVAPRAAAATD